LKISSIELTWFRGAATKVTLNTGYKSAAIYGDNGSGKSSFVDGFEYNVTKGKIHHLKNEYSDLYLNNCVRNIETPSSQQCIAKICFEKSDFVQSEIPESGKFKFTGSSAEFLEKIQSWNIQKHVLRQNEVADFIQSTKTEKYSILSPLLGLQGMEDVATNLIKIKESMLKKAKFESMAGEYNYIKSELLGFFTGTDSITIKNQVELRANKYITSTGDIDAISKQAIAALEKLLQDKEPIVKRYIVINNLAKTPLGARIEAVAKLEEKLAEASESYVDHKIPILENTETILNSIEDLTEEIECPACGRKIVGSEFKLHVDTQLEQLKLVRQLKVSLTTAKQQLILALTSFITQSKNEKAFNEWLSSPENQQLMVSLNKLDEFTVGQATDRWSSEKITSLQNTITEVMPKLERELQHQPPTTNTIVDDLKFFQTCLKVKRFKSLEEAISKVQILSKAIDDTYFAIRQKIASITSQILTEISTDIARIWGLLHPGQPIEGVHLSRSEKDKAIEVCLKFYGNPQSDPRLTLSEGHRNSLGLSIFLALANQGSAKENPIFLDDIVSSLDREHRGMVTQLLCTELLERQVILFTHDREWFGELTRMLDAKSWKFFTLKPYAGPSAGIELLPTTYTFEEAESLMTDHISSVGNAVRAIMDTELPKVAQKLKLDMPYLQGQTNDTRTAFDFLNQLISKGEKRFQINDGNGWKPYQGAIETWKEARSQLEGWANRATHGGSLSAVEAKKLIETCNKALLFFQCSEAGCERKAVWALSAGDHVRCDCGKVRWKIE
jgi:DNA repair exonuclease SbcCD ATPase subunit